MTSHKEWRKIAKRERRRRIRTLRAKKLEAFSEYNHGSYEYNTWLKEQEALQLFEIEQILESNKVENEKWLAAEKISAEKWRLIQEKQELLLQKRLEQEARLKLELELERKRRQEEEKRLKEIEEENKKKQEIFLKKLEEFLSDDTAEIPREWLITRETKPGADPCPFFSKTACCRFGDQCSRNHQYPGISKVLLATNFYQHFGLENANFNEYDTDLMLEYEDSDTYREYKEFFYDVVPEFERFGKVVQFKVCNNYERHLRGNVYVELCDERAAVRAHRALHSRWYAGRQLSLAFCRIHSWKNAVCGLQSRRRCPKGRACNFLHVFRNPNNMYNNYDTGQRKRENRTNNTPPRSWRWSESPEVELPRRRTDSKRDTNESEWDSQIASESKTKSTKRGHSPDRRKGSDSRHNRKKRRDSTDTPESKRSNKCEKDRSSRELSRRSRKEDRRRSRRSSS